MARAGAGESRVHTGKGGGRARLPSPLDPRRSRRTSLLLGLTAALLVTFVWLGSARLKPVDDLFGGLLESMEGLVMQRHLLVRGKLEPPRNVAVVAVDATSVEALGRWPWPRSCLGGLIQRLAEAEAEVIALDLVLSERAPRKEDDTTLAKALAASGNVVLGFIGRSTKPPSEEAVKAAQQLLRVTSAITGCVAPPICSDEEAAEVPCEDPYVKTILTARQLEHPVKRTRALVRNLDMFEEASGNDEGNDQGFFSHEREDGVQHRYDLVSRLERDGPDAYYPALALAAVARFRGQRLLLKKNSLGLPVICIGDTSLNDEELCDKGTRIPANTRLRLWINYAGKAKTFPPIPAWEALTQSQDELAERVRGKLVFVGVSEEGAGDVVTTPLGQMAGVEVHANAAANLLEPERQIYDGWLQALLSLIGVFTLALLVAWLVTRIQRHWQGAAAALLVVVTWLVICHLAFRLLHSHLHAVPPALAGVLSLVLVMPYQLLVVESRARRVKGLFQHYLSPDYIDELIEKEDFKLGGELKDLTVLFCDIRGFTTLSEDLEPKKVVDLLKDLFTPLTHAVLDQGGTLDKYMGDAIMAFFGAPKEMEDHATRACAGALAMVRELEQLNKDRREDSKKDNKPVHIGIGINSGEMTVGNMGSKEVFDYTVIGDAVNLGSRIEGLNKVYGTVLLVSEGTKERTTKTTTAEEDPEGRFLFRELDKVRVKGKEEPVALYELMAGEPFPPQAEALAERFAAALEAYRRRDFGTAEERFAALAAEGDPPAAVFLERCRRYRVEPPPEGWDGVERFETK